MASNATLGGTWSGLNVNIADSSYTPNTLGIDSIIQLPERGRGETGLYHCFEVVEQQQKAH
ncbi:MAG: hypothetical protein R2777_00200 [Chitinophagales bacterium]